MGSKPRNRAVPDCAYLWRHRPSPSFAYPDALTGWEQLPVSGALRPGEGGQYFDLCNYCVGMCFGPIILSQAQEDSRI
jgi:hypothetical protein